MKTAAFVLTYLLLFPTFVQGLFGGSNPDEESIEGATFRQKRVKLGTVIGIDLGTAYTCAGVWRNGRVEIIPNEQGNRVTPSYVAFTADGERLIGDAAKYQVTTNPQNTIFDIKRLVGRYWNDSSVQRDIKMFPFKVIDKRNRPYVDVAIGGRTKQFSPEEITAMLLGKIKIMAEEYLGQKISHAIVTVPAYFSNAQRQATKDAGLIAGLSIVRIVNEPTAAAIAYGLGKKEDEKIVVVFDMGGGTFDVSVVVFDKGVFEVLSTSGDTHLGGLDFDHRVMNYFIELYKNKTGKDVCPNKKAVEKLRQEAERAKLVLSSRDQVTLQIENFMDGEDFEEILTRAKFEKLNMDLFQKSLHQIKNALNDSLIKKEDINEVLMVGGSTRIPRMYRLLTDFFNGKKPSRVLNPDEAVATGAAILAGVISGEEDTAEIVLLDVNPLTLGIETVGGVMSKMIERNTVIPIKRTHMFTTAHDNQDTVTIQVYEGEHPETKRNLLLDMFDLTNIPKMPAGVPQIEVTFEIDINGILYVTAVEKQLGGSHSIVVSSGHHRLSHESLDRMKMEAVKFADHDKIVKVRTAAKDELESFIYNYAKQLKDDDGLGGELSFSEKNSMAKALAKKLQWMRDNPKENVEQYISQKRSLAGILANILGKSSESVLGTTPTNFENKERDEL